MKKIFIFLISIKNLIFFQYSFCASLDEKEKFYEACLNNRIEEVQYILSYADGVKKKHFLTYKNNDSKNTPFLAAILHQHSDVVKLLINEPDLKIHEPNFSGFSPLHLAASFGDVELVQMLLDRKVIVDLQSISLKMTALHLAVKNNHFDVVSLLLKHGACIDIGNADRKTPLHIAAEYGHKNITAELLRYGGLNFINKKDYEEKTMLHYALTSHLDYFVWFIKKYKKHIDFSVQDIDGNTSLHIALSHQMRTPIIYLILINPVLTITNGFGYNPKSLAQNLQLYDIVDLIEMIQNASKKNKL